ncbi:MAG: tRNA (guanosine(46)-N7)-methyltransferase TrmB [Litorimonas sp.]
MYNQKTKKFRTFGRAKGKALSPAQTELMETMFPKFDIGPAIAVGDNPLAGISGQVWLEIGFGAAEHLLWQAKQNLDVTIIGVEPFLNGVAKAVRGVDVAGLTNLRLHRGDARDLLALLPDSSLERVFILFPDPWHKTRHHKRRLINTELIEELHRVIHPNGILRFGSDIPHYVDWTLTRLYRHGGFEWPADEQKLWRERPKDWPSTRYLEKALREGRQGHFFEFIRKP